MADVDTDLVGIIVASVVCGLLLCVLVALGAVFCHRRLEKRRRKNAGSKNPLVDPALQGSDPNAVHESAETLSGYRPKILNSNEEGIPEADYQEFNGTNPDAPNGHATSPPGMMREGNKTAEAEVIVQQETTQNDNSSITVLNGEGFAMATLELYSIEAPPSSEGKGSRANSVVKEQNVATHSVSLEEASNVSKGNAQAQAQISGLGENENGNATRKEQTVVHIIPFDEVELPLVSTTKTDSQITASSSRIVYSTPGEETINSQFKTINYATALHGDEKEPFTQPLASQSSTSHAISSNHDIQSDPVIPVCQSPTSSTNVMSSRDEREPDVLTTQSLSRVTHFTSSVADTKPIVQTIHSEARGTHLISSTQDAKIEEFDHSSPPQTLTTHLTSTLQGNEIEPTGETGQSHTRTTQYVISSRQDNGEEPMVQNIQFQSSTRDGLSSSEDAVRDMIVPTAQSQARATHYVLSSTQDDGRESVVTNTQSQLQSTHYTFSSSEAKRDSVIPTALSQTQTVETANIISSSQDVERDFNTKSSQAQTRTTHFISSAQDMEKDPKVQSSQSQTRTAHFISSAQDLEIDPIVQSSQSQTRTARFISSTQDVERDPTVHSSQYQIRTSRFVSSAEDVETDPNVYSSQSHSRTTHFISSTQDVERDPTVQSSQYQTRTAHFRLSAEDVETDPNVYSSQFQTQPANFISSANGFQTEASVPTSYSQSHSTRLIEERAKADASRNIVIISSQTGPEGRRLASVKMPDATTDVGAAQQNGHYSGVVRTYTTRSNDGTVRTYTTRGNYSFVNGVSEDETDGWRTKTYEEKINAVDFERDAEADHSSDSSTVSSHGETSSEGAPGMVSMHVRDYSFTDGLRGDSGNQNRLGGADEYTILDYVDPNPSAAANAERNVNSVMGLIGDRRGSREFKIREDIDKSAEKVPPVFTSTPRAPPEMTSSYVREYAYRQRKEYEGSVQYPPEGDLVTPL